VQWLKKDNILILRNNQSRAANIRFFFSMPWSPRKTSSALPIESLRRCVLEKQSGTREGICDLKITEWKVVIRRHKRSFFATAEGID
jgi:hypothetical protein